MLGRARAWLVTVAAAAAALALSLEVVQAAGDAQAYYERALERFERGELRDSVVELKNALQRDRSHLLAHLLLARVYLRVGAPSAALEAVDRARGLGARDALTWPLTGQALLQLGRYEEVLTTVPGAGFEGSVQSALLLLRGHAQLALGRTVEAGSSYERALALAPEAPGPRIAIARASMMRDDLEGAELRARDALQRTPGAADAWSLLGDVLQAKGDTAQALDAYDGALARDPGHTPARLARAGVLIVLGRMDAAAFEIQALDAQRIQDPRLLYLHAAHLARRGRLPEARRALAGAARRLDALGEAAIARSPQLLMLAAVASFDAGELDRVERYLEAYLGRFPNRLAAQQLLARLLIRRGSVQRAVQLLEQALVRARPDHSLYALLADAYTLHGRHEIARGYFEKALALRPDAIGVRIRQAVGKLRSGLENEALAELEALFALDTASRSQVGRLLAGLLLARGDFDSAHAVTARLLAIAAADGEHRALHASALAGRGRLEDARALLERLVEDEPGNVAARVNLARLLRADARLGAAREELERALVSNPDSVTVMVELADLAALSGDDAGAMRWLDEARRRDPRSELAAIAMVEAHLAQGRAQAALAAAQGAAAESPERIDVLKVLARAQLAVGQRDAAQGLYQQISSRIGFDARGQFELARLQARMGAFGDAVYSLEKGLRDEPGHLASHVLRIELLARAGRLERALGLAQALREERGREAVAHRLVGQVLSRLRRHGEARAALERALRLEPSTVQVLALARALSAGDDAQGARAVISDWLTRRPGDVAARIALAELELAAGEHARAQRVIEEVIRTHGETPGLLNNLAQALERQRAPAALDVARRAYDAAADNPAVADTLGWVLTRNGRAGEGLRFLREAYEASGGDPEVGFHLAQALTALEREHEARRALEAALADGANFPSAAEARALLERLAR